LLLLNGLRVTRPSLFDAMGKSPALLSRSFISRALGIDETEIVCFLRILVQRAFHLFSQFKQLQFNYLCQLTQNTISL